MGNVTMPTPVALAAGSLCLLGGYLVGVVAGPDTTNGADATVASYDRETTVLCLTGDAVADEPNLNEDGELCGLWRRAQGATRPQEGDAFRYVALSSQGDAEGERATVIYGDVVPE